MIDAITTFIQDHALNILIILGISYFLHIFSMRVVTKLIRRAVKRDHFRTEREEHLREDTLVTTVNKIIKGIVVVIGALLILAELNINIGPLLASAGIVGVALGFGAQTLVKDFLSGLFILIENQYRVGDVVEINQLVTGTVQDISLRETVLRDLDGMVHHIPNGTITLATNMTMDFSGINLDIGVGYDTNIEKLERIINEVCEKIAADEEWKDKIIETPQFKRITEFGESAIIVKIVGKTEAMQQWAVAGEIRKRLKIAFDKNGIEIPFPQRVFHELKDSKK